MIRVILPQPLQHLAGLPREILLNVTSPVTQRNILDALESAHPVLRGSLRDHETLKRRPLVRFFACGEDISLDSPDAELPAEVGEGSEPFVIIGAIAGGTGKRSTFKSTDDHLYLKVER
jgi:hypothetical protein